MKKQLHNGKRRRTPDPTRESEEKKGPKGRDDTEELKGAEKTEKPETSAEPERKEPEASAEPERKEPETSAEPERKEPEASAEPEDKEPEAAGDLEFDEEMVEHLRVQTSLIEEREVSREETIEMLRRVMRQHSMAAEKRRDYVVRFLKEKEENPP